MTRLGIWVRYLIERWMLRGTFATLVILGLVLSTIAFLGATLAYWFPGRHFASFGDAFWWSVLRLSDPGYLSDDIPSVGIRALSVTLSVLGMAVTVGGIVTLVAQLFNGLVERLAAATTPVPFSRHVVLLGWTDRTPRLLQTLLDIDDLKVVVLREHVGPDESRQLARSLPERKKLDRVVLRRGSPMRPGDLYRAACRSARAIVLASPDGHAGGGDAGARQLKAVMALGTHLKGEIEQPLVVVEVVERAVIPLVEAALPGASVLHSDQIVARTLRLGLQSPGMLKRGRRALGPQSRFKVSQESAEHWSGETVSDASSDSAVVIGRVLGAEPEQRLDCDGQLMLSGSDQVLVARGGAPLPRGDGEPPLSFKAQVAAPAHCRVLMVGWSEVAPDLFAELALEPEGRYHVDLVSEEPVKSVEGMLSRVPAIERVTHNLFTSPGRKFTANDAIELAHYDRILIVADRHGTAESSNMKSLASVLEVKTQQTTVKPGAYVVTELLEHEELGLFDGIESVVTSELVADVLASLALDLERSESLQLRLELQRLYFSRSVVVDSPADLDGARLQTIARAAGGVVVDAIASPSPEQADELVIVHPAQPPISPME